MSYTEQSITDAVDRQLAAAIARNPKVAALRKLDAEAAELLTEFATSDVDRALAEGRIAASSRDAWVKTCAAAPSVGREILASMPADAFPRNGPEQAAAQAEEDRVYEAMFGGR